MKVSVKIVSLIAAATAMVLSGLDFGTATAKEDLRLLVLGDSLSAGYGVAPAQAFPAKLQAALATRGHAVKVINASVSGDTSAGGLARLDWVMGDKPHAVIVELGANDGLRGLDTRALRANLAAILARFQRERIQILLAGMKAPPNYGNDYVREFDRVFADLAKEYDVVFYPFFLDGVAARSELNQPDGIHPNPDGVDLVVRNILPAVERLLARVNQAG